MTAKSFLRLLVDVRAIVDRLVAAEAADRRTGDAARPAVIEGEVLSRQIGPVRGPPV